MEFESFCQDNGKILKGFKQGSDMIPFMYVKFMLAAVGNGYKMDNNKGRKPVKRLL